MTIKMRRGEQAERGTWSWFELGNTGELHPKGTLMPQFLCPECGVTMTLRAHDIALDGKVSPSCECIRKQAGCTFHDHVRLEGYSPMGDPGLVFADLAEKARQKWREFFGRWFTEFPRLAGGRFAGYGGYGDGLPNGTAASFESLVTFHSYVRGRGKILNAGAGASSWMLRRWYGDRVTCCDSVADYLNAVRSVCQRHGLPGDDYRWGADNLPEVDYAFYDYGEWMERGTGLGSVWDRCRYGMYVDDADDRDCNEGWRRMVVKFAHDKGIRKLDHPEAADAWGRWGCMLLRV